MEIIQWLLTSRSHYQAVMDAHDTRIDRATSGDLPSVDVLSENMARHVNHIPGRKRMNAPQSISFVGGSRVVERHTDRVFVTLLLVW